MLQRLTIQNLPKTQAKPIQQRISQRYNSCFLLTIIYISFYGISFHALADVEQMKLHKHGISAQAGLNGISGAPSTFGLQIFPFDVSYSYKFFDNNRISVSTSMFYDNIGAELNNINFDYRLGQRIDAGFEMKDTFVYGTFGFGYMVMQGSSNLVSPVYGFGVVRDITDVFAIVTELNFQDVYKAGGDYNIVNLSVGVIYSFDL